MLEQCLDSHQAERFLRGLLQAEQLPAIERHVNRCSRCHRLVVEMAKSEAGTPCAPSDEQAPSGADVIQSGSRIGRYVVSEMAGAGGMGAVYSAHDPELNRRLAIKVLRTDISPSSELQARLLREAQALARLSHPNVLNVYDVGSSNDRVFIAMEFIEGSTLREWQGKKPRSVKEIVDVFLSAGEGLAAAHRAQLVHRDFKPENVLVGNDGRVKVTDFGLARAMQDVVDKESEGGLGDAPILITASGRLLGTPAYMAPEQLSGQKTDARSDQFAFCVALYEALCGTLPHSGSNVRELANSKQQGLIAESPEARQLPSFVRRAILKGLSVVPEDRYSSMEELLFDLKPHNHSSRRYAKVGMILVGLALLAGATVSRIPRLQPSPLCRGDQQLAGVWNDQRRAAIRAAFSATQLPYAEGAFAITERTLDNYARQWLAMHAEACEATRLRGTQSEDLLDRRMICLDQRLNELKGFAEVLESACPATVERAVQTAEGLSGVGDCSDLSSLRAGVAPPRGRELRAKVEQYRTTLAAAKALITSGRFGDAIQKLRPVAVEAHSLGYVPLEAEALFEEGEAKYYNAQYDESASSLAHAVSLAEAARYDDLAARASILLLRLTGYELGKPDASAVWQDYAQAAIQRIGGKDELSAQLYKAMATIQLSKDDPEKALEFDQKALQLEQRAHGAIHYERALMLANIGADLTRLHRLKEAEEFFRSAISIAESTLGPEHPLTGAVYNNLSSVLWARRDAAALFELSQRALAVYQKTLEPNHWFIAAALTNSSMANTDLGNHSQAIEMASRALAIATASKAINSLGDFHFNYGRALAAGGHFKQALIEHHQALALHQKELKKESPLIAPDFAGIGQDWLGLRRPSKAVPLLDRALRLQSSGGGDSLDVAETQFLLAQALWTATAEKSRARGLAAKARRAWVKNGINPKQVAAIDFWLAKHTLSPQMMAGAVSLEH